MTWTEFKIGVANRGVGLFLLSLRKSSALVLGVIWLAAFGFLGLATIALAELRHLRADLAGAQSARILSLAAEQIPATQATLGALKVKLLKSYPALTIAVNGDKLHVAATDGALFRQWQMAVSYIETAMPDEDWAIYSLCVGPDCRTGLMSADVTGSSVRFSAQNKVTGR